MVTKDNINIHAGHRERLRENINKNGIYEVDDIHFLEYILTFTITRADTNPIAHSLLNQFGSIDEIFTAEIEALLTIKGIGIKTARFLKYMSVVAYKFNKSKALKKPKLDTLRKLVDFLKNIIPPSDNEQLIFVILNKNLSVKTYKIFKGTSHSFISLDASDVTEFLVKYKANFCAIAHTHPNHNAKPSFEDLNVFKNIHSILDAFSINMIENLILGEDNFYSLKEDIYYDYESDDDKNFINSKSYKQEE